MKKNKAKLTTRDVKPVASPKPLPQRGKEEPETTLCTVVETPKEKYSPILGWCKHCTRRAAHSLVDNLCYECHKEAQGLTFDDEQKRWITLKRKKMKWITTNLVLLATLLLVPCSFARSKSPRHSMTFPATAQSVPMENAYANRMMLTRFPDQRSIERAVEAEVLVPLRTPCSPRLPKERRYALPATVAFVEQLDQEFAAQTGHHLTVDSAVRSAKTQRTIRRWNRSAALADGPNASSHLRGSTVDLSIRMPKQELQWLLWKLWYYRELGKILVIQEHNCLHIFVGEIEPKCNPVSVDVENLQITDLSTGITDQI